MSPVGTTIPSDLTFQYVPYQAGSEDIKACGRPIAYNAGKEWANKKVVVFAVPGAFTPSCSERHLPGFISNRKTFTDKGVDAVALLAYNDPFVLSAWSKANEIKNDDILFLTDGEAKFSKSLGDDWVFGERTGRYALIIDNGKIVYAEKEDKPSDVSVSSADAVLAKL